MITELLIRAKKLDISLIFITQSYSVVPKDSRLNSIHYFVVKSPNKRELQHRCYCKSKQNTRDYNR